MNILYLISYAGRAGTEKYVENLMRTYSAQGHGCFLAYMEGGELAERAAALLRSADVYVSSALYNLSLIHI